MEPDSITIYQMELPYNTTISKDVLKGLGQFTQPLATWATKRRWVKEAFASLQAAGYHIGSAYTAVRNPSKTTIHLHGPSLAGRRHGRARRRVLRSHQRRSRSESGFMGRLQRCGS